MNKDMRRYRMLIQVAVDVDAYDASEARTVGTLALGVNDGLFSPIDRHPKPLRDTVTINGKTVEVNATYLYTNALMPHEIEPPREDPQ